VGVPRKEDGFELLRDLSAFTGVPVPAPLSAVEALPLRFRRVIDPAQMPLVPFGK